MQSTPNSLKKQSSSASDASASPSTSNAKETSKKSNAKQRECCKSRRKELKKVAQSLREGNETLDDVRKRLDLKECEYPYCPLKDTRHLIDPNRYKGMELRDLVTKCSGCNREFHMCPLCYDFYILRPRVGNVSQMSSFTSHLNKCGKEGSAKDESSDEEDGDDNDSVSANLESATKQQHQNASKLQKRRKSESPKSEMSIETKQSQLQSSSLSSQAEAIDKFGSRSSRAYDTTQYSNNDIVKKGDSKALNNEDKFLDIDKKMSNIQEKLQQLESLEAKFSTMGSDATKQMRTEKENEIIRVRRELMNDAADLEEMLNSYNHELQIFDERYSNLEKGIERLESVVDSNLFAFDATDDKSSYEGKPIVKPFMIDALKEIYSSVDLLHEQIRQQSLDLGNKLKLLKVERYEMENKIKSIETIKNQTEIYIKLRNGEIYSNNAGSSSSNLLIRVPSTLIIKSNKFELSGKIGNGAFSSVYKLKSKRSDNNEQLFAFKQFAVLHNAISKDEIKMIEREIEMLEHFEHDNIVKIIGAIGDPDARDINNERMGIGIVMEYCENGSLRSFLNNHQQLLNMNLILHLLLGAAQGLEYLHTHKQQTIIHGDIKSDNILIDKEYNAKLCDFGISKLMHTTMTSAGGGGTLPYKAPETFDGKIECKSDVYSFGCVILEMLTGERPWSNLGNDTGTLLTKMLITKEQHDLSKVRKYAKEELIDLMKRCLDYDKNKRPTMNEVRMSLEKMMNVASLVELDIGTDEYNKVESLFFPGGDKEGSLNRNNYRICGIEKVTNRFAEGLYAAEKKKIHRGTDGNINERILFHGTGETDPMNILNHPDAFMKDYSLEGFYGKGLYFAELARYSNGSYDKNEETGEEFYYRYNIPNTEQYQMLVCSVICGQSFEFETTVNDKTKELSQKDLGTKCHSIRAGPHQPRELGPGEDDSCMYVIYKDTQVVARYLITYEILQS